MFASGSSLFSEHTAGRTQNTDHFDLYEYLGNDWGIILMHPGDFTPVCTTELGKIAKLQHKFDERGVRLCGFSCNDSESHREWIRDIKQITGSEVKFPLFCDPYRRCASYLGILDETNRDDTGLPLTVRSVYILRPDKRVALIMTYPASTGRNVDEILRVFDSVKMTYDKAVATPVDWRKGDEVMINLPLSNADADLVFGKAGYRILDVPSERGKSLAKNYMRYTRDPSSGILSRIKRRIPGIRELSTSGALSLLITFAAMVTLTQVSPAMGFRLLR